MCGILHCYTIPGVTQLVRWQVAESWVIMWDVSSCRHKMIGKGNIYMYGGKITRIEIHVRSFLSVKPGGGGTRMARGGIRLVHGLTKSTLNTYFSGMKIDPKYAFLHACFLICLSCPFQNLSIWPKTHAPFFPILHVFAPLNDVRAYIAWSWKTTLIMWIFGRAWYPPWHSRPPPPRLWNVGIWNLREIYKYDCGKFAYLPKIKHFSSLWDPKHTTLIRYLETDSS